MHSGTRKEEQRYSRNCHDLDPAARDLLPNASQHSFLTSKLHSMVYLGLLEQTYPCCKSSNATIVVPRRLRRIRLIENRFRKMSQHRDREGDNAAVSTHMTEFFCFHSLSPDRGFAQH
jgi:hypothetical protein